MESTEELRKRSTDSSEAGILIPTDSPEKPTTHIRFLVSNAAAGSVIGKGGSTISEFQASSGARIQLSRNQEFFPGTTDRIIMISGSLQQLLSALQLILDKLHTELHAEDANVVEPMRILKLVVPNTSCGGIIGKGGATIKSFIEESKAAIKISPLDATFYGLSDRLVTLSGTSEEQMLAIHLILAKLTEDDHYSQNAHSPYSYPGYNTANYGPNGSGGKYQNHKEEGSSTVTIGVADEHIGLVLGRGGRTIMEITQMSGARIKISDRGDFISGTTERKVSITGSERAVQQAETKIKQKVVSASDRRTTD